MNSMRTSLTVLPHGGLLKGHTRGVRSLASVPMSDGRVLLASAGGDGMVRLSDPETGSAIARPLAGRTGGVWSLTVMRLTDGRAQVTRGGDDAFVRP